MRNLITIFIIGFLLNSCATLPSQNIPQSFSPNSSDGMIVGAIAFKNEKPIFNGYFFYYLGESIYKLTARKSIKIIPEQMVKMKFKPDFFDGDKAVYYFSIQEPDGEYSFLKFRISENSGYMQSTADIPIDIDFIIEKGKVKYLGEIYVDFNQSIIQLNDEKERDLKKLGEKFPNLIIE